MSSTLQTATDIRPFHVDVPDEELAELTRRISATRWPSPELVGDRSQGVQLATLQQLARYWATEYDWRKAEAKLNASMNCLSTSSPPRHKEVARNRTRTYQPRRS